MNRPHLKWCNYDNEGNVLPVDYKRLKDGTIVDTKCEEVRNEYQKRYMEKK